MRVDCLVIGAGAAGMYCAGLAAAQGGRVMVVDHAKAPGEKIRISGGGRCNFTNMFAGPENFLSGNPHFCKSALARHGPWEFVALMDRHGIGWHEKTLGQLFCDGRSAAVIEMLLDEMGDAELRLDTRVTGIERSAAGFRVTLSPGDTVETRALVVATGGKSIPKMGATGFGYDIARQFGLAVTETRAGLVPFVFGPEVMDDLRPLAGVAAPSRVTAGGAGFDEALLLTHRGLSGPACIQASSYWREGTAITVDLDPSARVAARLREVRATAGRRAPVTVLSEVLPERLARFWAARLGLSGNVADLTDAAVDAIEDALRAWRLTPVGTEGYRTAEVTLGGVDTDGLDARTMEAKAVPGLYFIGEVVDVTGWLGGYNFQWAWSSGWAAGTAIAAGGGQGARPAR
ncbi:BaiN/RdsA family NAD(P)/FAD-dependent oxidoreductase [Anianabacter salinae]|uniref:NAD(P)/FAD-dependent oxidoreductase n=1 Tax=Anianabacter salinae TaxID=2851023 RepID=UPI00225E4D82|nr:NAD(P)/FAD-dependent oxidoreductase [Anianabacter salinae]MBV0911890.1 NAD(P)/FAD-dependent oxidoreductase [Anianabacter salinae]